MPRKIDNYLESGKIRFKDFHLMGGNYGTA